MENMQLMTVNRTVVIIDNNTGIATSDADYLPTMRAKFGPNKPAHKARIRKVDLNRLPAPKLLALPSPK